MSLSVIQQYSTLVYQRHVLTNFTRGTVTRLQISPPEVAISSQLINDIWYIVFAYAGSTTIAQLSQLDDNFANIESYMISLSLHASIQGCSLKVNGLATRIQHLSKGNYIYVNQIMQLNQHAQGFKQLEATAITTNNAATQLATLSNAAFRLKVAVVDTLSTIKQIDQIDFAPLKFTASNYHSYLESVHSAVLVIQESQKDDARYPLRVITDENFYIDGDLSLHLSRNPIFAPCLSIDAVAMECLKAGQPEVAHSFLSMIDRELIPFPGKVELFDRIVFDHLRERDRDIKGKPIEDRLPGNAYVWDLLKPKPTPVVNAEEVTRANQDLETVLTLIKAGQAEKTFIKAAEHLTTTDPATQQAKFPKQCVDYLTALLKLPQSFYNNLKTKTTQVTRTSKSSEDPVAVGILDFILTSLPEDLQFHLLGTASRNTYFYDHGLGDIISKMRLHLHAKPENIKRVAQIFMRDQDLKRANEVAKHLSPSYGFFTSASSESSPTKKSQKRPVEGEQESANDSESDNSQTSATSSSSSSSTLSFNSASTLPTPTTSTHSAKKHKRGK